MRKFLYSLCALCTVVVAPGVTSAERLPWCVVSSSGSVGECFNRQENCLSAAKAEKKTCVFVGK
jgi:hypothetical protein